MAESSYKAIFGLFSLMILQYKNLSPMLFTEL